MSQRAKKTEELFKSLDYHNFVNANNKLPVLDIVSERFDRLYRVSISNHLRTVCKISHSEKRMIFSEWKEENNQLNCMNILKWRQLNSPFIVKLDRNLAYGIIETLTGGSPKNSQVNQDKEITGIELEILNDVTKMFLKDWDAAWKPIEELNSEYVRTEVNSQFIQFQSEDSKVIVLEHIIEFGEIKGAMEIIIPYQTIFPLRNKLFSN